VTANANVATPIDAAVAANVLSVDSSAHALGSWAPIALPARPGSLLFRHLTYRSRRPASA